MDEGDSVIPPLPSPTKSGYTYDGWYTEKNGGGTQFTTSTKVTADITVYAKWKPNGPGIVSNVKVTALSSTSIKITWDAPTSTSSVSTVTPSSKPSFYCIYRNGPDDGDDFKLIKTLSASLKEYTDSEVSPATTYYYRVTAKDSEEIEGGSLGYSVKTPAS
ncbi:MAG: InlB B-repeat-containing protein [Treponema sp.]|nr:InlB B-repeat-containing protein [Treponema sp.]